MAEFGSCRSTKDMSKDKFLVMDCNGNVVDGARTLDEAQVKADVQGCAIVIKVLRVCGGADIDTIVDHLRDGVEVGEDDFDYDEED